jgi:hypothetical protein
MRTKIYKQWRWLTEVYAVDEVVIVGGRQGKTGTV